MTSLHLPPSKFIRDIAPELRTTASGPILDIGCATGRNSLYLAQMGLEVVGVTVDPLEAEVAESNARRLRVAEYCKFVVADAVELADVFPAAKFGTVLVNEVLHQMPKANANDVLKAARRVTEPGGLHAVSGYVVDPERATAENLKRCFVPDELGRAYATRGWQVRRYKEDAFLSQQVGANQMVHSLAQIVAQKP